MHMADALISPEVGLSFAAISVAAIAVGCSRLRKIDNYEAKLPVLALSGAFIFAAQMINFAIPGTGSSGHIGGGLLLAAILGSWPAFITIAIVLFVQCLFFADGGLLALGCNIFNMGVIPCLMIYPITKQLMQNHPVFGSLCAAECALAIGAFAVVLETTASGIAQLPFLPFAQLMVPIHLAIAIGEGLATAAILCFLVNAMPDLLDIKVKSNAKFQLSRKKLAAVAVCIILLFGLGISAFASSNPDGLEWAVQNLTPDELTADGNIYHGVSEIQHATAAFPDYELSGVSWYSSWLAALFGIIVVVLLSSVVYSIVIKRQHAKC